MQNQTPTPKPLNFCANTSPGYPGRFKPCIKLHRGDAGMAEQTLNQPYVNTLLQGSTLSGTEVTHSDDRHHDKITAGAMIEAKT